MPKVKIYVVAAFTKDNKGGNLAGVVFDKVDDVSKQEIAKELGFSETVFVDGTKFRYFTPTSEIDFCGHATLAALSQIDFNELNVQLASFDIKAFKSPLMFSADNGVFIDRVIDVELVLSSLGLSKTDLADLGMDIVYTGLKDLFVNVKDTSNIKPDFELIESISKELDVIGYHVYSLDSEFDAITRNFAPLYGIPEESATGSANSGLAYLLSEKHVKKSYYKFLQGKEMNQESVISIYLKDKIYISGDCTLIEIKEINIGGN